MTSITKNAQSVDGREFPMRIDDMKGIIIASERLSVALAQAVVVITTGTAKAVIKGVIRECAVIVSDTAIEIELVFHDGRIMRTISKFEIATQKFSQAISRAEHDSILRPKLRFILMERLEDAYIREMDRLTSADLVFSNG